MKEDNDDTKDILIEDILIEDTLPAADEKGQGTDYYSEVMFGE